MTTARRKKNLQGQVLSIRQIQLVVVNRVGDLDAVVRGFLDHAALQHSRRGRRCQRVAALVFPLQVPPQE